MDKSKSREELWQSKAKAYDRDWIKRSSVPTFVLLFTPANSRWFHRAWIRWVWLQDFTLPVSTRLFFLLFLTDNTRFWVDMCLSSSHHSPLWRNWLHDNPLQNHLFSRLNEPWSLIFSSEDKCSSPDGCGASTLNSLQVSDVPSALGGVGCWWYNWSI